MNKIIIILIMLFTGSLFAMTEEEFFHAPIGTEWIIRRNDNIEVLAVRLGHSVLVTTRSRVCRADVPVIISSVVVSDKQFFIDYVNEDMRFRDRETRIR